MGYYLDKAYENWVTLLLGTIIFICIIIILAINGSSNENIKNSGIVIFFCSLVLITKSFMGESTNKLYKDFGKGVQGFSKEFLDARKKQYGADNKSFIVT